MSMQSAVMHGWYRMTDIIWEWQKVLPEQDVTPFKSFIHSEALTSPDHPFWNPSQGGVELFIGVLKHNNESRLLYSSKQIEYIRYWIKAMGFVDHLLPLPHSEWLLTVDMLSSVAPIIIKTAAEMKQQQKQIDKLNKRLRGAVDVKLAAIRQIFERVRAAYGTCKGTWIALDFESWELAHDVITEFGFVELKWRPADVDTETTAADRTTVGNTDKAKRAETPPGSSSFEPVITRTGHWILEENQFHRNGTYCPDNRDCYAFGRSEVIPRAEFIRRIRALIRPENHEGPVYLVFHDHSQDVAYLTKPKYKLEILEEPPTLSLPETPPTEGLFAIDTSLMFAALEGDNESRRKLEDVYRRLKHSVRYDFHNAGNDAKYTLDVLQEMATGGPLDTQRERRWPAPPPEPGQPPKKTVRVEDWRPEDESDYEDVEMLMRPDEDWVRRENAKPIIGKPITVTAEGEDVPYRQVETEAPMS